MDQALSKQMEFIIEIDKLKNIFRRTKNIHDPRLENDAEHTWHLAIMAVVLQPYANQSIDLLKVLKMLLIHDLVEIDAGDTFAYDAHGMEDKLDREMRAAKRIFGMLPADQNEQFTQLWLEFEKRETAEAAFAASLDRLQPLLQNYLNQGDTWKKYNVTRDQVVQRNQAIAHGSVELWAYAQELIENAVKQGILTSGNEEGNEN